MSKVKLKSGMIHGLNMDYPEGREYYKYDVEYDLEDIKPGIHFHFVSFTDKPESKPSELVKKVNEKKKDCKGC